VSKLHLLIESVTASYDKFYFGEVGRETYDFFWADFADWYVGFILVVRYVCVSIGDLCGSLRSF